MTPRRWIRFCNPDLSKIISNWIGSEDWVLNTEQLGGLKKVIHFSGYWSYYMAWLLVCTSLSKKLVFSDLMFEWLSLSFSQFSDNEDLQNQWRIAKRNNKLKAVSFLKEKTGYTVSPDAMFDIQVICFWCLAIIKYSVENLSESFDFPPLSLELPIIIKNYHFPSPSNFVSNYVFWYVYLLSKYAHINYWFHPFSGEAHSWIQETTIEYIGDRLPLQEDERNECKRKKRNICSTSLYLWRESIFHLFASQEDREVYYRCGGYSKPWSWNWWLVEGTMLLLVFLPNNKRHSYWWSKLNLIRTAWKNKN